MKHVILQTRIKGIDRDLGVQSKDDDLKSIPEIPTNEEGVQVNPPTRTNEVQTDMVEIRFSRDSSAK